MTLTFRFSTFEFQRARDRKGHTSNFFNLELTAVRAPISTILNLFDTQSWLVRWNLKKAETLIWVACKSCGCRWARIGTSLFLLTLSLSLSQKILFRIWHLFTWHVIACGLIVREEILQCNLILKLGADSELRMKVSVILYAPTVTLNQRDFLADKYLY